MEEKKWRLGEDMFTSDSILDGVTFDDLILTLHCNYRKDEITRDSVIDALKDIMDGRIEDLHFIVRNNMDKIIEYSRDYYRDD